MKGFIAKTVTTVGLSGAVLGCYYRDIVDPCYPQRYEYAARMEVNQALAPQVRNGHILEQTVWNYEFEPGTPRLTPGGMDHLAYLARRRPAPSCTAGSPPVRMRRAPRTARPAAARRPRGCSRERRRRRSPLPAAARSPGEKRESRCHSRHRALESGGPAARTRSPYHAFARRVRRARQLLADGQTPAQAAVQAGFADQSHMTRAFVRQLGITPSRYRAAVA